MADSAPSAHAGPPLATELQFRDFVAGVQDFAMLFLDRKGIVMSWNAGAELIKGYKAEEIIGSSFKRFYTDESIAVGHPERELEVAALTGGYTEEGWRVRADGARFWARVQITALRDEEGEVIGFTKVTTDLTSRRQSEEQLRNIFTLLEQTIRIDQLTGLPNRRSWDERLSEEFSRSKREGQPLAVAMLDLDNFKRVNDEHGHAAGDQLLKRCAVSWRQALRETDILARYGGEEFTVALPNCELDTGRAVIRRVLDATPNGQTCSGGLALWSREETLGSVLSRADRAMYQAKGQGRNQLVLATDEPVLSVIGAAQAP